MVNRRARGADRIFIPPKRLPEEYRPLFERVHQMCGEGRLQTALQLVLAELKLRPDDPGLLFVAGSIFVHNSRTARLTVQEPLPSPLIRDVRLDPIFTVCSACQDFSWVSGDYLMPPAPRNSVINPVGLQCQKCGFVCCRECLTTQRMGTSAALVSRVCPECAEDSLGKPVLPTGRPSLQMARFAVPVAEVFVLREGPLPPSEEELKETLCQVSPDAVEDGARIFGRPAHPWPKDPEDLLSAWVTHAAFLPPGLSGDRDSAVMANFTDPDGSRLAVLKLSMPRTRTEKPDSTWKAQNAARGVMWLLVVAIGLGALYWFMRK